MKTFSLPIAFFFILASQIAISQVITVTPSLPNDLDAVEVIFDAAQGNAGLAGYTGDVYAHTGVITNMSTGPSDWKYVKADWGVNIPACKLTSLGGDKWKLVIGPSIRQYYGVPAGEQIQNLAFVFRSGVQVGGKWLEGKTATGGDIFYDVFQAVLSVKITNPDQDFIFTGLNQPFDISVSSLLADSTFLYAGNQLLASVAGNLLNYTLTPAAYGRVQVKAVARAGTQSVADSFYYYVRGAVPVAALPQGIADGINYIDDNTVVLCLYAPLKEFAYTIGDFSNWLPDEPFYMNRTPDGNRYWVQINGLQKGKEYIFQYLIDGSIAIGDPYAEKVSDPWNDKFISAATYPGLIQYPSNQAQGIATVLQTAKPQYSWTTGAFTPPAVSDLMIYELLIRDFTDGHTFQSIIDTLGYLKTLGINAIELMPVNEFEGNLSWGYNPNYYFAVDKYYGPANDLKKLVDICHQNGIAVILDMVLNHSFGTSPYVMLYWDKINNQPASNSPYYNPVAKHDFNVGFDMNHESPDTKRYVGRILRYWLEEFKIDGYRFDLSKGFTQKNTLGNTSAWGAYDASRIAILKAYHDTIVTVNPDAYLILEHFAENAEEKELAANDMLLWGNMNGSFCEAAMGYHDAGKSNFSWGAYTSRGWSKPNLVTFMESHDEERVTYKCLAYGNQSGSYRIKDTLTAIQRMALNAVFMFSIPGPKMIWQFGERGFDYSINYPSGTSASRLDAKPPRWNYMNQYERYMLYKDYSGLLHLRNTNPLFRTSDFQMDVSGAVKKISLSGDGKYALIMGNFDVVSKQITPGFQQTGTWYDYMSGDSLAVTNVNSQLTLAPGEYRLYLSEKTFNPYGIETYAASASTLAVYPNPAKDICYIQVNPDGEKLHELSIYDITGKKIAGIFSGTLREASVFTWTPSGKGVYLVKLQSGNYSVIKKLIIQ